MHVLVAGGSGVLGRALIPRLLGAGHSVRAFSRSPVAVAGAECVAADLLASDLAPLARDCDGVIHAATAIPADPRAPGAWDLNTALRTTGTRRLLEAARGAGARRYIQQSIVMIYADGGDAWLDESAPIDPIYRNGAPVLDMEAQVQQSGLAYAILRGGQFVGPGTAGELMLEQPVPCDGRFWISTIEPDDFAAAMVLALSSDAVGVFNVAAEPVRYADYVDDLAARAGRQPPPRALDVPCPPSRRCSSASARTAFGWAPVHARRP